ncbi:MAG TPA: hypothetical protein VJ063_08470 [Verrucomicrobiae bacterium]|nr:hypothetical protein [Verrucomicrobiae bacterium]
MKGVLGVVWLVLAGMGYSPARDLIINGGFESPTMPSAAIERYAERATNLSAGL